MARPGIMIYFDILDPIKKLSDEDKGKLLVAMLEYGKDGIVPELDGSLGIVWSFVQPKIDRDEENYDASKLQRQYAAFCKKRKKIWMPRISFDEWVLMSDDERERSVDPVESRNPSTSTSTTAPSTIIHQQQPSTINHQPQPSSINHQLSTGSTDDGDDPESNVTVMGGSLGKGVLFLSQEQMDDLLDRMGIETFDYYVDKLSRFIIEKKARVKNHYETILKWWHEDGKTQGGANL